MGYKNTTVLLDIDNVRELKSRGENISKICRDAIESCIDSDDEITRLNNMITKLSDDIKNYTREKNRIIDTLKSKIDILNDTDNEFNIINKCISDFLITFDTHTLKKGIPVPDISVIKDISKNVNISWTKVDDAFLDSKRINDIIKDILKNKK